MKLSTTSKTVGGTIIAGILASVIMVEGGYVNNPSDPGGETVYGITEKVARSYGYEGEMKDLSLDIALAIYESQYVKKPGFDQFVEINPAIAHKLIDAGINVGTSRVTLWLQRALNSYSRNGADYAKISLDGQVGPQTINAYKNLEKKRGKTHACTLILKAIDSYQAEYYMSLNSYNTFLVGWMDKRVENVPLDQCETYTLHLPFLKDSDEDQQQ